jgi:hypothetical protein
MTKKLNLTPLIKHFSKTNPVIATRLGNLTESFKTNKTALLRLQKLASTLVEIGNELDATNPALAAEADALLQEVVKQAQGLEGHKMMGCTDKCMGGHHDHQPAVLMIEPMGHGGHMLHDSGDMAMDDLSMEPSLEDEDPTIEEVTEPEPEYDMVSLEDIKSELEHMKFRIADRSRREALESAIEHIEKAMDYHKASKSRRDKVHNIFDGAGLALRLKDFE